MDIVVPIDDTIALTILLPVRRVPRNLSGSLITLYIDAAFLFFCLIKKSRRTLFSEKKDVSVIEKKADKKSVTKNKNSMKMIVVFEKCIESIIKIPSNSF